MRYRLPLVGLLLAGAVVHAAPVQATTYSFTAIDDPAATGGTYVYGINDVGQLVGKYSDNTGTHGFVDTGGRFTTIDGPSTDFTSANGINDSGQIVGSYSYVLGTLGFEQTGGSLTTIMVPSNSYPGLYTVPQGINSAGVITGYYNRIDGSYGFVGTPGNLTTFDDPVGTNTIATGINAAGQIVGSYEVGASALYRSFLDTNGVFTTISSPVLTGTVLAYGINDQGQIVGGFSNSGFVDTDGSVTVLDDPGATYTIAQGINDVGQIVGYYSDSMGTHGFLATPVAAVPEPASLLLTGTAVAGLGLLQRRRHRHAGCGGAHAPHWFASVQAAISWTRRRIVLHQGSAA